MSLYEIWIILRLQFITIFLLVLFIWATCSFFFGLKPGLLSILPSVNLITLMLQSSLFTSSPNYFCFLGYHPRNLWDFHVWYHAMKNLYKRNDYISAKQWGEQIRIWLNIHLGRNHSPPRLDHLCYHKTSKLSGPLFSIYICKWPTLVMVTHHYICFQSFIHEVCKADVKKVWKWAKISLEILELNVCSTITHGTAHGRGENYFWWDVGQAFFFFSNFTLLLAPKCQH